MNFDFDIRGVIFLSIFHELKSSLPWKSKFIRDIWQMLNELIELIGAQLPPRSNDTILTYDE